MENRMKQNSLAKQALVLLMVLSEVALGSTCSPNRTRAASTVTVMGTVPPR